MSAATELKGIVADYIKRYRKRAAKERRWFAIQRALEDAIRLAALAKGPTGKRLAHQRRIPESSLRESHRRLAEIEAILRHVLSFEQLHALVASRIQEIAGIGELTIYDTALRIGSHLRLEPSVVFLHAGTRVGARRLGLDASREFLAVQDLPSALHLLSPCEIEDVLCIYKNRFTRGARKLSRQARCYG